MDIFANRLLVAILGTSLIVAPLILWLFLCVVAKTSSRELRGILPWIRVLRWVGWSLALVLFLLALVTDDFQHFLVYAIAIGAFSTGLALPEGWLKRNFVQAA